MNINTDPKHLASISQAPNDSTTLLQHLLTVEEKTNDSSQSLKAIVSQATGMDKDQFLKSTQLDNQAQTVVEERALMLDYSDNEDMNSDTITKRNKSIKRNKSTKGSKSNKNKKSSKSNKSSNASHKELQLKEFLPAANSNEDITKTVVITDDQKGDNSACDDYGKEKKGESGRHRNVQEEEESTDDIQDKYVKDNLFRLQHGFKREEFALTANIQDNTLNALQELTLVHRPHTSNFRILMEQIRAMQAAATVLQFDGSDTIENVVKKCERVFLCHQSFDQVLESEPTQYEAIKSLYQLVRSCHRDTTELIQDWSLIYYTLLDLVQRFQTLLGSSVAGSEGGGGGGGGGGGSAGATSTISTIASAGLSIKSPKARKSIFSSSSLLSSSSKKYNNDAIASAAAAARILVQIPSEAFQHHKDVCANWVAQMRSFQLLAQAYRRFSNQATEFVLIKEIESITKHCGEEIQSIFEKAQMEFENTKQLYQLHYQIDYTNIHKVLPKENALTTAEERKAQPIHPVFSRDRIGHLQLIRSGKLTEYVSPSQAVSPNNDNNNSSSKKKGPVAVSSSVPKEYQLIIVSGLIYLCEIIATPITTATTTATTTTTTAVTVTVSTDTPTTITAVEHQDSSDNTKSSRKDGPQKGTSLSSPLPSLQKQLRLLHEPVLVIDSQISSTPDVIHPPLIQKNIVMVCFYNHTSYILQAESSEERDAWIKCSRKLNIEQPKPTDACREQDEN
ncbi:hypothetical protein BX616_005629, partial [Lobosporangium transversale]